MQEAFDLTSILDYGILGVLAIILYCVGRYAGTLVNKLIVFMEAQAQGALVSQAEQLETWKRLTREHIETQAETAHSLKVQTAVLEKTLKSQGKDHEALSRAVTESTQTFVRWHEQAAAERKLMLEALREALDQAKDLRLNGG